MSKIISNLLTGCAFALITMSTYQLFTGHEDGMQTIQTALLLLILVKGGK